MEVACHDSLFTCVHQKCYLLNSECKNKERITRILPIGRAISTARPRENLPYAIQYVNIHQIRQRQERDGDTPQV